ncbi:MAG: hypothetical protein K6C08_07625 [Oscillospiraceae bacterium]|nr:hypothetical protein [Oscillospiraceae bacterium]
MKKVLAFLVTAVMLLSLSACTLPKNSTELYKIYSTMKKVSSFHVTGTVTGNTSVRMLGLSFDVPFTVDADFNFSSGQSHGTADVSLSLFDKTLDVGSEVYTAGDGTVYMKETVCGEEDADTRWSCFPRKDATNSVSSENSFSLKELLTDEFFESLEYIHDREAGTFTIVVPLSGLTENPAVQTKLEEFFSSEKVSSLLPSDTKTRQTILESLGQCTLTFVFDRSHHLTSLRLSEFSCELMSGGKLLSRTTTVHLVMNLEVDNYNQVEDISIPEEIRNCAVSGDLSNSRLVSAFRSALSK